MENSEVKVEGTITNDVMAYIDATSGFELKFRIKMIGGNRVEIAFNNCTNLCFSVRK